MLLVDALWQATAIDSTGETSQTGVVCEDSIGSDKKRRAPFLHEPTAAIMVQQEADSPINTL